MGEEFMHRFRGRFTGILRWQDFDRLWNVLQAAADGQWFIYHLGESPPAQCASDGQWRDFLAQTAPSLKQRHQEDYCGLVYVDDADQPGMVKIFDPDNLGVVCGYSEHPPLPAWVLSRIAPCDLPARLQPPPPWWRRWWPG